MIKIERYKNYKIVEKQKIENYDLNCKHCGYEMIEELSYRDYNKTKYIVFICPCEGKEKVHIKKKDLYSNSDIDYLFLFY